VPDLLYQPLIGQVCTLCLQVQGGKIISADYMPDVLHPNAAGMEQLLTICLDPALGLEPLDLSE